MKSKDIQVGRVYFDRFREKVHITARADLRAWARKGWWRGDTLFADGRVNVTNVIRHSRALVSEVPNQ